MDGKWWRNTDLGKRGIVTRKKDTLSVVVIDEEKEKALKFGYITLHTKLFMDMESISSSKARQWIKNRQTSKKR